MEILLRMQAFGDPGQAFCNCFLFCILDKTVFGKLKQIICCRRQNDTERTKLLSPSPSCEDNDDTNDETTSVKHLSDTEQEQNSSGYSSVASTRSELLQRDSVNLSTRDRRFALTC